MDIPEAASDKLRLDAEGRVDEDITCRKCGYNLRGLPTDGACPECGSAVGHSTHGDLLRFCDEFQEDPNILAGMWGMLQELYGHRGARRYLGEHEPSEAELRDLIAGADAICLGVLIQEDTP